MRRELILGCGTSLVRRIEWGGRKGWEDPVRLDLDESCAPDVVWDLDLVPLPFSENEFDEIHAYDVLEHTGTQGDWRFFFEQFEDLYRLLKPDGLLYLSFPRWDSVWAWGDPGHTRVLSLEQLVFLDQDEYESQVGKTAMTDYRAHYRGNLKRIFRETSGEQAFAILRAIK